MKTLSTNFSVCGHVFMHTQSSSLSHRMRICDALNDLLKARDATEMGATCSNFLAIHSIMAIFILSLLIVLFI